MSGMYHALGVSNEVWWDVASVKLHAFYHIQVILCCPRFFLCHHSCSSNSSQGLTDQWSNLQVSNCNSDNWDVTKRQDGCSLHTDSCQRHTKFVFLCINHKVIASKKPVNNYSCISVTIINAYNGRKSEQLWGRSTQCNWAYTYGCLQCVIMVENKVKVTVWIWDSRPGNGVAQDVMEILYLPNGRLASGMEIQRW